MEATQTTPTVQIKYRMQLAGFNGDTEHWLVSFLITPTPDECGRTAEWGYLLRTCPSTWPASGVRQWAEREAAKIWPEAEVEFNWWD